MHIQRTHIIATLDSEELCADLTDLHNIAKLQQECPDYRDLYAYIAYTDKGVLPDDSQRCRKFVATATIYM